MANTIQDKLAYLEETKGLIKEAIIAKGVSVSEGDTFRSYADKIETIEAGGGTGDCSVSACFDDVGYTFVPVYIQEGLETAAQFKAAWKPENTSIDMTGYEDSTVFFPKIDTSNVTTLKDTFADTSILVFPNNDFPALNNGNNDVFTGTFSDASRLVSIDFGNLADNKYLLLQTFSGCNNLERIYVHNENTSFKISLGTFKGCNSLSDDIGQCNIFEYIDTDNTSLYETFKDAKLVRDFTFTNPTSLYSAFANCNINNKNITFIYNDYSKTSLNYWSYSFFEILNNEEPTNTLKFSGKLTLSNPNNMFMATISQSGTPYFNKLDLSNMDYTNNASSFSSSADYGIVDDIVFSQIDGVETFTETFPNATESNYYKCYLLPKLFKTNYLSSMPSGLETYWNKIKDKFANITWGKNNMYLLYNTYRLTGTVDLSFLDIKIDANPNYIIYSVGNFKGLNRVTIRLDNVDWSDVSATSATYFMNSQNVEGLYTPFNFDSCTGEVNISRLINWTDHDSLIWSLLTHSTDRTAQSLGNQTIRMSPNSYNALTEDERSQIEAKGYTLTT